MIRFLKIKKYVKNFFNIFSIIDLYSLFFIAYKNGTNFKKIKEDIKLYSELNNSPDFDKKFYLNQYSHVKNKGINPIIHYIYYGKKEGKFINKNNMIFSKINKNRDNSIMDIIFLSIIPYNYKYYQRPQHISNYFSNKGYHVHYINPYFSKSKTKIETINEKLHVVNLLSENKRISNEFSLKSFEFIKKQLNNYIYNADIVDFVIFLEFPYWGKLAKYLKETYNCKIVFDILDEFSGFHPDDKYLSGLLDDSIQCSDLLITTSEYLYEKVLQFNKKTKIIRNGTEFEHFNNHLDNNNIPNDLLKNEKPIVGYYGALSHWFDYDKIEYLAKNRLNYDFVLIGNPEDSKVDLRENLENLNNIKFLGHKKYTDLPKYLKKFDIALIPFKADIDLIKATNPVKFYEYLSMGKKIVATEIPELLKFDGQFAYLTNDNNEFMKYIDKCIEGKDTLASYDEKIEFAKTQSWDSRCKEIEKSILELYKKVSIIIITYNNLEYTKKCLNSIFQMTSYPNYEIIIVDNCSIDDTVNYLKNIEKEHDNVKIILNSENLGFAKANNIGIRKSDGEYIILLNNDTIVTSGWISGFIKYLSTYGLVGPVTNSIGNEAKIDVDYNTEDEIEEFSRKYRNKHFNEVYSNISVLAMFCLAMKMKTFENIGELDENFEIGMFEDDDFSYRAKLNGYDIVCAEEIFIHHFGGTSFSKIQDDTYKKIFEKNKSFFENKWDIKWIPHKYRK